MNKISENDVFEYYKNGLPNDFILDSSKVVRREKAEIPTTIQISIKFEFDLLKEIKEKAEKKGLPYQTFMKQILKNYLKNESISNDIKEIKEKLYSIEKKINK
ncbi:MAG: CopG family antitoxin [Cyanobacteriota bacterium]